MGEIVKVFCESCNSAWERHTGCGMRYAKTAPALWAFRCCDCLTVIRCTSAYARTAGKR